MPIAPEQCPLMKNYIGKIKNAMEPSLKENVQRILTVSCLGFISVGTGAVSIQQSSSMPLCILAKIGEKCKNEL